MSKIDFVVAWVDGSDPNWVKEEAQYKHFTNVDVDDSIVRYRDWDLMKYWFRGVEEYAPWVNRIYFITWGHYPKWLNIDHRKITLINHRDYIPKDFLPTFNSHTIELNINRIKELEEQFVYFNDDMFLISPVKETDFFENGKPKDSAILSVHCNQRSIVESHIPVSVVGVINDHFQMKSVIRSNVRKWINPKYSLYLLLRSACLYPCPRFPGFWQHHLPTSFLKSSFDKVWLEEEEILKETCSHKFRTPYDVSQWLIREWQICEGCFEPRKTSFGKSFHIDRRGEDIIPNITEYIRKQKGRIVVINDGDLSTDSFERSKAKIRDSFESILPNKSSFER